MTLEVGLATWMSDADKIINRCEELSVSLVTLRAASLPGYEENGFPDIAALREMQAALNDAGIKIAALIQWFGNDADLVLRPESHRREIDGMLRTLEIQGELDIPRQLHYVDVPEPEDPSDDEAYWEGMLSIYRETVPQAEKSGVKIANHGIWRCLPDDLRYQALADGVTESDYRSYRPKGWAGPYLVRTADHVRRIVESVPSHSHGYTMCAGLYITGGDPVSEVRRFGSKIFFVQVRDLDGRWPAAREVFPGTGDLDLPSILKELVSTGYSGFLHPEHLGQTSYEGEDLEKKATELVAKWVNEANKA